MASKRTRMREVIARLKQEYPDSKCSLDFRTPWELVVATALSAQCTDERVNEVTPRLFAAFPTPAALAHADVRAIEEIVRPTGFYRNKAKNIQRAAQVLLDRFDGVVPKTVDELIQLPGVARKTANVVVHVAFDGGDEGSGVGVVVDTHVTRIANRLRFVQRVGDKDAVRIERYLTRLIERPDWGIFTHLIIDHGRAVCSGRSRPRCETCVLAHLCPSADPL